MAKRRPATKLDQIKKLVSMSEVVEGLGGRVRIGLSSGDWTPAHCPLHDDPVPSASVSLDDTYLKCHAEGCGFGGDIFELVIAADTVPVSNLSDAIEWFEKWVKETPSAKGTKPKAKKKKTEARPRQAKPKPRARQPARTREEYLERFMGLSADRLEDFPKVFDLSRPILVHFASLHLPDGHGVGDMIETAGRESVIAAYVDFVKDHPREKPLRKKGRQLNPRLKSMVAGYWRKRSVNAREELRRAYVPTGAVDDLPKILVGAEYQPDIARVLADTRNAAGSHEAYEDALRSIPDGHDAVLVQYVDWTTDPSHIIGRELRQLGQTRLMEVWGSDMRDPSTLEGLRGGYAFIDQAETVAEVVSQEDYLWNLVQWFAVDWPSDHLPYTPDEIGPRLIRGAQAVFALCRGIPLDEAVGPLGCGRAVRVAHADEVEAFVDTRRRSHRDREVLRAIAQAAREDGAGRMTARSLRDLADLAGTSKDTVLRGIRHLDSRGLVWVVRHLRKQAPPIIVLTLPNEVSGSAAP